jgi:DnaJ-class molecular chaperone
MLHDCFADEIAIDFPSVRPAVERMRDAFLGERDADVLFTDVSLSPREAFGGSTIPVQVPVRVTCPHCGGRGETWTEACSLCRGTGDSWFDHVVKVSLPPGIADGARVRFRVTTPERSSVRVEVRIAIRPAAV